jgi:hypothetical protein
MNAIHTIVQTAAARHAGPPPAVRLKINAAFTVRRYDRSMF